MEGILDYIQNTFLLHSATQGIIILAFVCGIGLLLSKVPMGNFSLGITWVFFSGILAAHFGLSIDPVMNTFVQNFGLVFFIYALGLQVGPSFFPSLRSGGVKENLLSLVTVLFALLMCVIYYYSLHMPMSDLIGVLSGATTNTPVLAAAQSTISELVEDSAKIQTDMALACAVSYPLGVVGMILGMIILSLFVKQTNQKNLPMEKSHHATNFTEFEVLNPAIVGLTIAEVAKRTDEKFVVTRIWQKGKLHIPNSQTRLDLDDHILVASKEEEGLRQLEILFGKRLDRDWNKRDIDWNTVDKELVSRRLVITNREINGKKLEELKLRTLFGVNVTRIDRSGIELFASPQLYLQFGDRLSIVGEKNAVNACERLIGNEVKTLDTPNILSIFIGILLGAMLGMVPIALPGMNMAIKLGLAGGPIIVGILIGAFGPRFKMTTYITNSAGQLIQKLGITIYLAALGLASGADLFHTIMKGDGLLWLFIGFTITVIPVVITGWIAMRFFRMKYGSTCGMLCGSMANPMALEYLDNKVGDDSHNVSYATVYPVNMFVRIIAAQIMLLAFL